jgi:hypothetical protein
MTQTGERAPDSQITPIPVFLRHAEDEGFGVPARRRPTGVPGSALDPIFQFFQIRHQALEWWRFDKEHFPHVPVVASNPRKPIVWRAYTRASRFGKIIPRRGLAEKDFLVIHHPPASYAALTFSVIA